MTDNHHHHGECSHHHHHECGCQSCSCHHHHHEKYADQLLALADEAWTELLKDKIKEQILKNNGKQLDDLAKLVSNANHDRWKHKIKEFGNKNSFEEDLHNLLYNK